MILWKIIYWIGCLAILVAGLILANPWVEPEIDPSQWKIQAIKAKGPGTTVMLEPGWKPIGYDRDANVVYIMKKVTREEVERDEQQRR